MNPFAKLGCRIYQKILFLGSSFLDFKPRPLIQGLDAPKELARTLSLRQVRRPFVVVDPYLHSTGLDADILKAFEIEGMRCTVFDEVIPNPTIPLAEKAADKYAAFTCDCFVAIGGGSSIDLAKAAMVALVYPKHHLSEFKGILKVHRALPFLAAVPSTAGTGSETTVATVVIDPETKDKFQIDDPKLIPATAVLYPKLLSTLPKKIISSTGMDALTHAVEAYIGKSNNKTTKEDAIRAVKGIHKYLYRFYENSRNEAYAQEMLLASYHAGKAFTRAYVGYVHALAHSLGGTYNVPHGLANAVLLPIVLKAYGKSIYGKLAALSDAIELVPKHFAKAEKARNFIAYIENLNLKMGLPRQFDHLIHEEDLDALARHASKEGNPLYPVPKIFGYKKLKELLKRSDVTWGVR